MPSLGCNLLLATDVWYAKIMAIFQIVMQLQLIAFDCNQWHSNSRKGSLPVNCPPVNQMLDIF